MINPIKQKTVAAAVGSLLIGSVAGINTASASGPFAMTSMESGYMVADKAGEGKCGGKAIKDGHGMKDMGNMNNAKDTKEGKCGDKAMEEDKGMKDMKNMNAAKTKKEGKCGEGKCGGSGL